MTPTDSPIIWDEAGAPRSRLYGDIYFSRQDGLAEARAVFLAGCGLPQAWAGRSGFCIAELGFGSGLNIAAVLAAWRRTRPPASRLSVFTIEAHPLSAPEAARALIPWPEIADIAALLTSRWPPAARGFHRIDLPELAASVDVAIMDAEAALTAWSGMADAWFLDGFAPARNPQMWTAALMDLVARRSAPGAKAATYTVAAAVRRALQAAGFEVARRPGFGAKRERLEAWLAPAPGPSTAPAPAPRIAVVGAGIAGASLARAFHGLGADATVFDDGEPCASRFPAALVMPRLDAGLGPPAELFAQAARRARSLYEALPGAVIARHALQLEMDPKDRRRFAAIAASDLFEAQAMRRLTAKQTSAALGEPAPGALRVADALVVEPGRAIEAWAAAPLTARVARIAPGQSGWRLTDGDGEVLMEADIVVVAAGMASAALVGGLAFTAVRGQASLVAGEAWPVGAVFGGYVIPAPGGVLFGATHDRGVEDTVARSGDDARNLAALAAILPRAAARLGARPVTSQAAIRATTGDYLPLAGAAPGAAAGLFVLSGLGSRGFTLAPLLAEHVASVVLGAPSPLPALLAELVEPGRFERRARRRGRAAPRQEQAALGVR
jgi:tRNA 5-methylaminomethyl-2-thiouridine biosynthesis bifunctional protein